MPSSELHKRNTRCLANSLLIIHNNVHIIASSSKLKPPKVDRFGIGRDCNEESWNAFVQKWTKDDRGRKTSSTVPMLLGRSR